MARTTPNRYAGQRKKKSPPHVSLRSLRAACGLTLDQVCERIREDFPEIAPTRGALSAIESGTRGPSAPMLNALCAAYGLEPGAIVTDYEPFPGRPEAVAS